MWPFLVQISCDQIWSFILVFFSSFFYLVTKSGHLSWSFLVKSLKLINFGHLSLGKNCGDTLEFRWLEFRFESHVATDQGRWDAWKNIIILTHAQYNGRWSTEEFQQLDVTLELVEVICHEYHSVLPISHVDSLNHVTK